MIIIIIEFLSCPTIVTSEELESWKSCQLLILSVLLLQIQLMFYQDYTTHSWLLFDRPNDYHMLSWVPQGSTGIAEAVHDAQPTMSNNCLKQLLNELRK